MAFRRASGKRFQRTSSLLEGRIRSASESRGFTQSRLLTHWAEIAGPEFAQSSRPVEVTYARGGMGATLVLLTTGAQAPMLEMQKEKLRDRVNATYGYNAISRIRITQTAPVGFAEGQVEFTHAPKPKKVQTQDPAVQRKAESFAKTVEDEGLRRALAQLGENILNRSNR